MHHRRGVAPRPTARRGVTPGVQIDPFQHPQADDRPRVPLLVQSGEQRLIVAGGAHRRHLERHPDRRGLNVEPIRLRHQTNDTLSEHTFCADRGGRATSRA